jgi:hypothetical protein
MFQDARDSDGNYLTVINFNATELSFFRGKVELTRSNRPVRIFHCGKRKPLQSEAQHEYRRTRNLDISLQIEISELWTFSFQSKIGIEIGNFRGLVDFRAKLD